MEEKKLDCFLFFFCILICFLFFGEKSIAEENSKIEKGDVIINELMWMGMEGDSSDEWIELKNTTSHDISLSSCYLEKKGEKTIVENDDLEGKEIPAGEFFVISRKKADDSQLKKTSLVSSKISLHNSSLEIKLKCNRDTIDIAGDGGKPLAGKNDDPSRSMERKDPAKDGTKKENWQTCFKADGFLDKDSEVIATPGKENSKEEKIEYSDFIKFNEIYPYPSSGEKEFIEIINTGSKEADIINWKIEDESGHTYSFNKSFSIKSGEFLKIENNFYLNNTSSDSAYLFDPNGEIKDQVSYEKAIKQKSLSFDQKSNIWKWTKYLTPGKKNEFEKEPETSQNIFLSEILPNPSGEEAENEFIEISSQEERVFNLSGWKIKDTSSKFFTFDDSYEIEPNKFLVLFRKDFGFALNNNQETIYLLDPWGKIIDRVFWKSAKENISYNFDGKYWRFSQYLTPGKTNKFNYRPKIEIDIDDDIYKNIYAGFKVTINDKDAEIIKTTWDFGDGHKSYKQETQHKYKKNGKYKVNLRVFDGSEEIIKKFTIKVTDFPKYNIEIVSLCPNPKGKDSENEWIEIKNNEKKKINLQNWSLASGWNNLYNHPIREDFKIKPDESKKIYRNISSFYLNNKRAHLELRYPNGKIADEIKYEREKIGDDDIYQKIEGDWHWIIISTIQKSGLPDTSEEDTQEIVETDTFMPWGEISKSPEWQEKVLARLAFIGFGTSIHFTNFEDTGKVLGIYSEKTRIYSQEKHWAQKIFEDMTFFVNQKLGLFFLK